MCLDQWSLDESRRFKKVWNTDMKHISSNKWEVGKLNHNVHMNLWKKGPGKQVRSCICFLKMYRGRETEMGWVREVDGLQRQIRRTVVQTALSNFPSAPPAPLQLTGSTQRRGRCYICLPKPPIILLVLLDTNPLVEVKRKKKSLKSMSLVSGLWQRMWHLESMKELST